MSNPSDVDLSWDTPHHTLGRGPTQAAPGVHTHKLAEITDYQKPKAYEAGVSITNASGTLVVVFAKAFPVPPVVIATVLGQDGFVRINSNPTAAQFSANTISHTGALLPNCYFYWIAIEYGHFPLLKEDG
jgi:hypothetical protein